MIHDENCNVLVLQITKKKQTNSHFLNFFRVIDLDQFHIWITVCLLNDNRYRVDSQGVIRWQNATIVDSHVIIWISLLALYLVELGILC